VDRMDEVDGVDILFWRIPNRDCAIGVRGRAIRIPWGMCAGNVSRKIAWQFQGISLYLAVVYITIIINHMRSITRCRWHPLFRLGYSVVSILGRGGERARFLIGAQWVEGCRRKSAFSSLPGREKRGCANRTPFCHERDTRLETGDREAHLRFLQGEEFRPPPTLRRWGRDSAPVKVFPALAPPPTLRRWSDDCLFFPWKSNPSRWGKEGTPQESPRNIKVFNHRSTGIKPAGASDISVNSGAKPPLHRPEVGGGGFYVRVRCARIEDWGRKMMQKER